MQVAGTILLLPPASILVIMYVLRYWPHKMAVHKYRMNCDIRKQFIFPVSSEKINCFNQYNIPFVYYGDILSDKKQIYLSGFNDSFARLVNATKKSIDWKTDVNIVAPIMQDLEKNRRFLVAFGQKNDCIQIVNFFKSINFIKNNSITSIVSHSLGGARLLTLYDLLKNKDQDFLKQTELSDQEASEMFEKLKKMKKCVVAPLLDLQETLKFQLEKFHIPFSGKLSKLICHYCIPFITAGRYDSKYATPKQRLQSWESSDFENFHFFYPECDSMVGNMHVDWLCNKIGVEKNLEMVNCKKSLTVFEKTRLDLSEKQHESSLMIFTAANIAQT